MVQEVFFFTEMAYSAYPQDVAEQRGYTALMLPNSYFDPQKAHALYQGYFEEYQYASEIGFDGVMINEHHNNPLNMMPSINVITGTPDQVIAKLQKVIDVVNPAWLVLWAREGLMPHVAAMRCLELLGKEVIPAIKDYHPKVQ
jgi:alkanesulfonate monooxygenase SsuD/methylene tetrahydromethanopterin reductase-like flavin-dependent oxidoreductase (luciferase family)